jgi:Fe-S cluster assembly protein SufD
MGSLFGETKLFASLNAAHKSLVALESLPWPSVRDDAWKYTDLVSLGNAAFSPVPERDLKAKDVPEALKSFLSPSGINIVFYNGSYAASVSSLSIEGIEIGLLNKAGADNMPLDGFLFQAMNAVCAPFAYVINIHPKKTEDRVLHIVHWNDKKLDHKSLFPRIFIRSGAHSSVKIVESFFTKDEPTSFINSVTDIQLEDSASVEFVQVFRNGKKSMHVASTRVTLKAGSSFRSFQFLEGGNVLRNDLKVQLNGEGASASVNGLHQLKGKDHADSHTFIEHVAPNASSDQLYKAILDDASHSVFHGRVYVHKDAQQTNSYQLNKNLLLSRDARVDTKPQLEIFADDVKCSHGAAIGQMDDEELFYLQTRGIAKDEAVRMLVKGFIDDVVGRVKDDTLRSELVKMVG